MHEGADHADLAGLAGAEELDGGEVVRGDAAMQAHLHHPAVGPRGVHHGADNFQGEGFQSKPRHGAGRIFRCFRRLPRSGPLAALLDGVGRRPAARRAYSGEADHASGMMAITIPG
jgi:hypothetical protein